VTSMHDIGT